MIPFIKTMNKYKYKDILMNRFNYLLIENINYLYNKKIDNKNICD
jgi:hypothetical protein